MKINQLSYKMTTSSSRTIKRFCVTIPTNTAAAAAADYSDSKCNNDSTVKTIQKVRLVLLPVDITIGAPQSRGIGMLGW